MKQQINLDLLKQSDEVTEERMANEFPYPLENKEIFERAYQNYLEQSQEQDVKPVAAPIKRNQICIISTAACCILILGAFFAFWKPGHQIPTVPEDTDELSLDQSEIATTQELSETSEKKTTDPLLSVEFTTDEIEPDNTVPITSQESVSHETDVIETLSFNETHEDVQQRIELNTPSEFISQPTDPQMQSTEPTATETQPITQSDEPELLSGFSIEKQGEQLVITCCEEVAPSPDQFILYLLQSEEYNCEESVDPAIDDLSVSSDFVSTSYSYYKKDGTYEFSLTQMERSEFTFRCHKDAALEITNINNAPGVIVTFEDSCLLYWDYYGYTFCIEGLSDRKEELLLYAQSISPVTE